MTSDLPSREDLAFAYLDQLPYTPYPFQEQAILSWFDSDQGLLVSAPTGMGKTLIAEAGLFEALKTGKRAYYTTPLIALTEQKYEEIKRSAERWGFSSSDVGLITGNRRENPEAPILVVVAEILFNRLLSSDIFEAPAGDSESVDANLPTLNKDGSADRKLFSFDDVSVVVMDEFHNFSDPERGIVWEFTIGLLPPHVRTLLISATVGNAYEFVSWLRNTAHRTLALVQSDERKVPLTFCWVGDKLLPEHLEEMHSGTDEERLVPALVFCFNRDECWDIAEVIKGRNIIDSARQKAIGVELDKYDWTEGAGPKLRQLLLRGIGIHHAGILPKYRRIVEKLFQQKLLSIAVCTETLAAGINLPARSVVLPTLMKGPFGDKKMVEASSAHQIFGRAGRPQYDDRGYVFVLAHEDDVRIARFREKYDTIPDDTKDPKLREAKKKLKKKMPTRNPQEQYWSEAQFEKLRQSPPGKLTSRGPIPWRLLAHAIEANPDLKPIRTLVARRLMGVKRLAVMQKSLDAMLLTLWRGGFIRLDPNPADYGMASTPAAVAAEEAAARAAREAERKSQPFAAGLFDDAILSDFSLDEPYSEDGQSKSPAHDQGKGSAKLELAAGADGAALPVAAVVYKAEQAWPADRLSLLTHFRGVNPLYGAFLLEQLGTADRAERIQAFESLLEMPAVVARSVRVPKQDELPPGNLARTRLDAQLLELGLATPEELVPKTEEERREEWEKNRRFGGYAEEPIFVLSFAEKLKRLFEYEYSGVLVKTEAVWAAGEILLEFKGDFNKFITSNRLQKQEGIIFRHLLRLILLLEEFRDMTPVETTRLEWETDLTELGEMLIQCCRKVDPTSTEETLKTAQFRKEETKCF
ncbi:MAG: DEAD/DEAH box helicase [Planctomycetia bacterium]|nr:DEAD/DEAH box helicase [Planctomycetia bacterium]